MFKDPKTANARIYVGNLNENVNKGDLDNLFQKYGNLQGILLQKGFAFVQFDQDQNALNAIDNENGAMLKNRNIIVRCAAMKNPGNKGNFNKNNQNQKDRDRSRSPGLDSRHSGGGGGPRNQKNNNNPWNNDNKNNNNNNGYFGGNNNNNNNSFNSSVPSLMDLPTPMNVDNSFNPDYNDCEIIVVSRALTAYAELIETQLKRLGLSVDLLFPNEDVPIGKVLANIASRGSLYGILVTNQNEQHRSMTVTQLYGENTVEHRNMPVEDAVKYIFKDFKKKTNKTQERDPNFPTSIQFNTIVQTPELKEAHPEPIQILLSMLADNRPLTVLQYERIIKYLTERKEMQIRAEIGDDLPEAEKNALASQIKAKVDEVAPTPAPDPEIQKQEELQKKIMEILNKPSLTETIKKVEEPKPVIPPLFKNFGKSSSSSSASSSAPSKVLKDEKVQKALSFLLLKKN